MSLPPDELLDVMGFPEGSRWIEVGGAAPRPCSNAGCFRNHPIQYASVPGMASRPGISREGCLVVASLREVVVRQEFRSLGYTLTEVGRVPCKALEGGWHGFYKLERTER